MGPGSTCACRCGVAWGDDGRWTAKRCAAYIGCGMGSRVLCFARYFNPAAVYHSGDRHVEDDRPTTTDQYQQQHHPADSIPHSGEHQQQQQRQQQWGNGRGGGRGGGSSSGSSSNSVSRRPPDLAKQLWDWCQMEGGALWNYSQGEIREALAAVGGDVDKLPAELTEVVGKR